MICQNQQMLIQELILRYRTGRVSREVIHTACPVGAKAEAYGNIVSLGLSWLESDLGKSGSRQGRRVVDHSR